MKVPVILNVESAVRVLAGHPFPANIDPTVAKHNIVLHALCNLASEQRQQVDLGAMRALDLLDYMLQLGYRFKTQWCHQRTINNGSVQVAPWQEGHGPDPEVARTWKDGVIYLRVIPENVGCVPLALAESATTPTPTEQPHV